MMITKWIQRVAGWDGLLPGIIWGTSALVTSILPGDWNPLETLVLVLLAVVMPISTLLLRLRFGWQAIQSNYCGPWICSLSSQWRFASLTLGLKRTVGRV